MKQLTQIGLMLLALTFAFAGCDAAKDMAKEGMDKAKDGMGDMADMANIDFGGFDMAGTQEKFTGITDGFKDVTADNVDGLTSKITDLSGSMEGLDKMPDAAKSAFGGVATKFADTVKSAMDGISDEGILGKLKPAVDGLMEKLNGFM